MIWTNILTGLAQVLVPAIIIYLEQQGWLPTGGVASVLATLGAATHSAVTTTVSQAPH